MTSIFLFSIAAFLLNKPFLLTYYVWFLLLQIQRSIYRWKNCIFYILFYIQSLYWNYKFWCGWFKFFA